MSTSFMEKEGLLSLKPSLLIYLLLPLQERVQPFLQEPVHPPLHPEVQLDWQERPQEDPQLLHCLLKLGPNGASCLAGSIVLLILSNRLESILNIKKPPLGNYDLYYLLYRLYDIKSSIKCRLL